MKKILKIIGIILLIILFPIGLIYLYFRIVDPKPAPGQDIDGQAAGKIDEINKKNKKATEGIKDEVNNMPIDNVVDRLKQLVGWPNK